MVFASLHNPVIDFGYGQTENQEKTQENQFWQQGPGQEANHKGIGKKEACRQEEGSKEEIRFEEGSGKSKDRA
ncbi:MAG: hypothetical protein WB421_12370 [Terriglobales bacterium]